MNFQDYQDAIKPLVKYPNPLKGNQEALTYCALGLCGESGEYAEKVKKAIRDGTWDTKLAALELGDVLWYLTCSAMEIGLSLDTIAQMNLRKLQDRQARGVLKGSGDER